MAPNTQTVASNALGWQPQRTPGMPPLVDQLVHHCQQLLQSHSLRAGTRLPSVRQLADSSGVSRDTVVQAYDRLVAQGGIHSRPGAGFYVSTQRMPHKGSSPKNLQAPSLAPDAAFDTPFLLRSIFRQHDGVHFDGSTGMLPASWMDHDMLNAAVRAVGRSAGMQLLSYGAPQGYAPLRQQLSAYLLTQGLAVDPEQELMTVTGVTQGMDLVLRSMLRPGDAVLVEDPAWFLVFGLLRSLGVRVVPVPRLRDGPDIQALEQLAQAHQPKLFITNSVVHNPTGFGLSLPVAYDLLRLAEQHNFLILEDDTYADFVVQPTRLATLDRLRRVLLIGGFSKTLAGSLRVGYIAASPARIQSLTDAKLLSGLTSPELGERVVHRILADGHYRKHVQRLRERLDETRHRCLKMVEHMGLVVHQEPLAGMFAWVDTLHQDTEVLARKAAAQGVLLAPGVLFSAHQQASTMLRLPVAMADDASSLRTLQALL